MTRCRSQKAGYEYVPPDNSTHLKDVGAALAIIGLLMAVGLAGHNGGIWPALGILVWYVFVGPSWILAGIVILGVLFIMDPTRYPLFLTITVIQLTNVQ